MAPRGSYLRIADDLKRRAAEGQLATGALLPSEQALMAEYSVSRGTVRAALATLTNEGLLEVVPGRGRRVVGSSGATPAAETAWEKVAADLRKSLRARHDGVMAPLPSEAEMAVRHGVSRNTVRRAYRELVEEGLVVVRHGAGAYPASGCES